MDVMAATLTGSLLGSAATGGRGGAYVGLVLLSALTPLVQKAVALIISWLTWGLLLLRQRYGPAAWAYATFKCPSNAVQWSDQAVFMALSHHLASEVISRPDVKAVTSAGSYWRERNVTYQDVVDNPDLVRPILLLADDDMWFDIMGNSDQERGTLQVRVQVHHNSSSSSSPPGAGGQATTEVSIIVRGPSVAAIDVFVRKCIEDLYRWRLTSGAKSGRLITAKKVDPSRSRAEWVEERIQVHKTAENCFYNADLVHCVRKRLDEFLGGEQRYKTDGVPWKFSLLLHGDPGTGKTSFVHMLASMYAMNIYTVDFTDPYCVSTLLRDVPPRHILLLDEMDLIAGTHRRDQATTDDAAVEVASSGTSSDSSLAAGDKPLLDAPRRHAETLRTLLALFDGYTALHGVVVVMITNYPGSLDPALIRECRVDLAVEMTTMDATAVRKALAYYYGAESSVVAAVKPSWGGRVRSTHLLGSIIGQHKGDPEGALRALQLEMKDYESGGDSFSDVETAEPPPTP